MKGIICKEQDLRGREVWFKFKALSSNFTERKKEDLMVWKDLMVWRDKAENCFFLYELTFKTITSVTSKNNLKLWVVTFNLKWFILLYSLAKTHISKVRLRNLSAYCLLVFFLDAIPYHP